MMAFDPPTFAGDGSLGGAVASGLSGPGRPWYGALRDAVLGVTLINGRAQRLKFGGSVMKNVAGYDVSRLMAGAFGTLGVLLDVSIKVLPRPQFESTRAFALDRNAAHANVVAWARSALPLSATCHADGMLHVRLSGTEKGVRGAVARIGGDEVSHASEFWDSVRDQTHAFFRRGPHLSRRRCRRQPAYPALDGDWLTEWAGAQRWFKRHRHARCRSADVDADGAKARRLGGDVRRRGNRPTTRRRGAEIPSAPEAGIRSDGAVQSRRIVRRKRSILNADATAAAILATESGRRADAILRACVHCGFCNATCPTYLLTGDELDGPRGRIYLVKEMLEADAPSSVARDHLDRCLTCRACETTCPSGVAYGELAEIGRDFVEARGASRHGGPVGARRAGTRACRRRNVSRSSRAWGARFARCCRDTSRARSRGSQSGGPAALKKPRAARRRTRRLRTTRHDAGGQRRARSYPGRRRRQGRPRRR